MNDIEVAPGAAASTAGRCPRLGALAATGLVATFAAMVATTLAAALAEAAGVDFEIPDGGEAIPLPGFAAMTGIFSLLGIGIAVALLRWSARPVKLFVSTAVSLTAISLVAPFLSGANTATVVALLGLHLVAAAVVIPTLAQGLRTQQRPAAAPAPTRPRMAATFMTDRSDGGAEDAAPAQGARDE